MVGYETIILYWFLHAPIIRRVNPLASLRITELLISMISVSFSVARLHWLVCQVSVQEGKTTTNSLVFFFVFFFDLEVYISQYNSDKGSGTEIKKTILINIYKKLQLQLIKKASASHC